MMPLFLDTLRCTRIAATIRFAAFGAFHSLFIRMAQPVLPDEIVGAIEAMACRRVHNGAASNFGLIIGIDVDFDKKIDGDLQRELEAWLVSGINIAHRALEWVADN